MHSFECHKMARKGMVRVSQIRIEEWIWDGIRHEVTMGSTREGMLEVI